jgi:hypothetical protein
LKSLARDPIIFQNLQLLSRSFSGILRCHVEHFLKSSAAVPDFFVQNRGTHTCPVGKFDDYSWVDGFCCKTVSFFSENLQLRGRSFSGILSS